jgi:hypothetical protein
MRSLRCHVTLFAMGSISPVGASPYIFPKKAVRKLRINTIFLVLLSENFFKYGILREYIFVFTQPHGRNGWYCINFFTRLPREIITKIFLKKCFYDYFLK